MLTPRQKGPSVADRVSAVDDSVDQRRNGLVHCLGAIAPSCAAAASFSKLRIAASGRILRSLSTSSNDSHIAREAWPEASGIEFQLSLGFARMDENDTGRH